MTRQPRLDLPGLPQHIIQRGNNRAKTFVCADDSNYFHRLMNETSQQHGVAIHAYVLMSNHVHLLATPGEGGAVGRMMQSIGVRYVRYFNARYGRSGTLWEGRYRATVVEVDAYLMACYRYIELNPVRAGLVAHPADFRWSSHRCNAGLTADEVVAPHPLFTDLGASPAARHRAYLHLFDAGLDARTLHELREQTNKGWALGRAAFKRQLAALGSRRPVPLRRGGDRRSPARGSCREETEGV